MLDLSAVGDITHGLYLVASHNDGKLNGQIVDALIQVSASPPTVAVAINKKTLTHDYVSKSRVFSITTLAADVPMEFIKHFGFNTGRNLDKYQNMTYEKGVTGCPVITDHSLSCMEAEVRQTVDVGTHTMFIGEVVFAKKVGDMAPITYRDYKIAKGVIAQTSPSFIPPSVAPVKPVFTLQSHSQKPPAADADQVEKTELSETKKEEIKMDKYVCTACGYVYDPEKGDPDGGVAPGTPFEKIPDDWVCPLCGVDKTFFEKQ